MQPGDECVFCAIIAGLSPASIVYQDDRVIAFMSIAPVTPGHVLVVPRRHAAGLTELDEPTGQHLFTITLRLAQTLRRSGLRCEGINLFLADGTAAFQDVFHVHLHVFPRFEGDGFTVDADWSHIPDRAELDRIAALLRQAYAASGHALPQTPELPE